MHKLGITIGHHLSGLERNACGAFVSACVFLCFVLASSAQVAAADVASDAQATARVTTVTADSSATADAASSAAPATADAKPPSVEEEPWDYSPYRIRIWIASNDPRVTASSLREPLSQWLDRTYSAVWRTTISDAPASVRATINRDLRAITYDAITSADPVLAIKRDHPDAPRLRIAADVSKYVKQCLATPDRLAEVKQRGVDVGNPTLNGVDTIMKAIEGDSLSLIESWKNPQVEAVLLNRGMAAKLKQPEAKLISLPIDDLVMEEVQDHDKIFIVRVDASSVPRRIEVVELDCLMRHFSAVVSGESIDFASLPVVIGQALTQAFGPIVRIEDAGQKTAVGLVRASGLVVDPKHPALISQGEFLQPMVRKNDRNGDPIAIGPIPWAFLHVKKVEKARVDMDLYAGRMGGLQGRKNSRTFRMALRTRPTLDQTIVRLHAQGNPNEPLAGYEIYEKELDSIDMTMVGRTDWNGKLVIGKTDKGMRLLYVKNGGAILARLPVVPGLTPMEVADLVGDDQRLRAEAYIRGTQNAIVDLIAIRTLLAARIRLRLEKGQMNEAKELLQALRDQPTYDTIANDMGKKVVQIKGRNGNEQRKIDEMFAQTREMLVKNINSKLLRDLEEDVAAAEANGGVLKKAAPGQDASAASPPAAQPAATPAPAPAAAPPVAAPPVAAPES